MEVATGFGPAGPQLPLAPGITLHAGLQCNDGRPITESWRYKQAKKLGLPIVRKRPPIIQVKERKIPFVTKYAPKASAEVIGNKDGIRQLSDWLTAWPTVEQKAVLISGPPGIGKTSAVHLIAAEQGYKVTEYNASDTRSVSMLRGLFAFGIKRLQREIIVMDEVDGFTGQERGGVGELAELIRKANVPIVCIANQLPPKMKPLQSACLGIKFSRPVKSTIATALLKVVKAENLTVSKAELEEMCEKNGNDIRAILNALEFGASGSKDAMLRLDLFSATQKLFAAKRIPLVEAEDLVYVDYGMIPLMVQEGYVAASRSLDELVRASEDLSQGDLINQRLWKTQDWTLLPHVVHTSVAVARTVSGPAPFQIFPQLLGKNAKRGKHRRRLEEVARIRGGSAGSLRLNEAEWIHHILMRPLASLKGDKGDLPALKGVIARMDAMHLSRDQLVESVGEIVFGSVDLPTKVKTAFTREYNKGRVVKKVKDIEDIEEEEEEEEEIMEIE